MLGVDVDRLYTFERVFSFMCLPFLVAELWILNDYMTGSTNLRVGLATEQSPVVVPHCIAHHMPVPAEFVGDKQRKKGSVAEQGVCVYEYTLSIYLHQ